MIDTGPILKTGGAAEINSTHEGANNEAATLDIIATRYEAFVDVVCAGARFGASDALEAKYARSRNILLPELSQVGRLLEDSHTGDPQKVAQLLERVLASNSLVHLLSEDDGSLIPRLTWISQALFDASSGVDSL